MVRLFNIDRHWSDVRERVNDLADTSLSSGICQNGAITQEIEGRIAKRAGKKHCVTFASCSDALAQGLRNLKLPPRAEVLVPEYTFVATINAIKLAGYTPVLCDVDDSYHIDLDAADALITANTKAIVYVTLWGQPARTDIAEWCKTNNLILVEDAAQSFGAPTADSKFSVLSFSPTKPCTSFGSGGALVTDCIGVAEQAKRTRLHGNADFLGINSMISTTEASAIQINLGLLDEHLARRKQIAYEYFRELAGKFEFPRYLKGCTYSKFVIKSDERNLLKARLEVNEIQTGVHYNGFMTQPNCKHLSEQSLTLPNCSYITDKEVERVIKCLKEF